MGEKRIVRRLLVGKSELNRPLGRSRRRWVDNIKVDLGEIEWSGIDWIDLAQIRGQWRAPVNTVMELPVRINTGKFLSRCTIHGLSRKPQLYEVTFTVCITYIHSYSRHITVGHP
jgi:hypothetical protein